MRYIIYLSLVLLAFSSCRTSGFTKQRYTHYGVSHHRQHSGQPSTRPASPHGHNPVAEEVATSELRTANLVPAMAMPAVKSEPALLASADSKLSLPVLARKAVKVAGFGKQDVKTKKTQAVEKAQRGPIGALLDLIFTIVLIVVLVFVVILLILLL